MAKHHMKHKFEGGKVSNDEEAPSKDVKPYDAQGSEAEKEAKEKKRGGKVEKKEKRADGGKVEGHKPKMRMDRACRASGGRVGSDKAPFSSATMSPAMGHKTDD